MLIGFVQGYEELKWGISKLNPLCNGPQVRMTSSRGPMIQRLGTPVGQRLGTQRSLRVRVHVRMGQSSVS